MTGATAGANHDEIPAGDGGPHFAVSPGSMTRRLASRSGVLDAYPEVFSPAALQALEALAPLNRPRRELMEARIARRLARSRDRRRIAFLDPDALIEGTGIRVKD